MNDRTPLLVLVLAGVAERWDCPAEDSPLARAATPVLDGLAEEGRVLGVQLLPEGSSPCDAAPLLAILGLDPAAHETSRASYRAALQGVGPGPGESVASADFVALFRDEIADLEPGPLREAEAEVLMSVATAALARAGFRLFAGEGTHHLVLAARDHFDPRVPAPELALGKSVERIVPRVAAHARGHRLAREVLDGHEINALRRELGDNGADMIWLSEPGGAARIAPRSSPAPAVFGEDAVWRGVARAAGLDHRGGETADSAQLRASLGQQALCFLHARRGQADAVLRDADLRAAGIEALDAGVVSAARDAVAECGGRLMVLSDRAWQTRSGAPTCDPVPVLLWGAGVRALASLPFHEASARAAGEPLTPGHGLLDYVLHL